MSDPSAVVRLLDLREVALDPTEVLAAVDDPAAGGVNLFVGVVRNHDDGEQVELRPGSVVRLRAGERTTWVVHETIRKIYVA